MFSIPITPSIPWAGPDTGYKPQSLRDQEQVPIALTHLKAGLPILGLLFYTPKVQIGYASKYLKLDLWSAEDMLLSLVVFPEPL